MFTHLWDLLLLITAVGAGWTLGRVSGKRKGYISSDTDPEKLKSLINWFDLHNESDVQNLVDNLIVTPETIETHLAIASMFRKKGEFSKSLAILQNLFGRPNIPLSMADRVQYDLGCDFLSLGMTNRAESLFDELIRNKSVHTFKALEKLIQINDSEHDWSKCVHFGEMFGNKIHRSQSIALSHHYCELAEIAIKGSHFQKAEEYIKKAQSHYSINARAFLQIAELKAIQGKFKSAFKYSCNAVENRPESASELLPIIKKYADACDHINAYGKLLDKLNSKYGLASTQLAQLHQIYLSQPEKISQYLDQLGHHAPSRKILVQVLNWQKEKTDQFGFNFYNQLIKLLEMDKRFQCDQCGFETSVHSWQCPQCKQWDRVQDKEDRQCINQYKSRLI